MLAKRFVSGKNWGGFDEKKLEKKSHRQNVTCWVWENLISKQKLFILKNLTMPKTVKWGLWDFLTSILLQNFRKKLKGDPLETLKKQKKWKFSNFIVPKNLEKGTLWEITSFIFQTNAHSRNYSWSGTRDLLNNFAALIIFLRFSVVSKIHENGVWCARMIAGNSKNKFLNQKPFKKQKIEEIFFSEYFLNQGFR